MMDLVHRFLLGGHMRRFGLLLGLMIVILLSGCDLFEEKVEFDVSFRDHDGQVIENIMVTEGRPVEEPGQPEREGYDFLGWSTSPIGSKDYYDFTDVVESNLDLYAKWSAKIYRIELLANGEVVYWEGIEVDTRMQNFPEDVPYTMHGYDIVGYYLDQELTTEYVFDRMPSEDIQLHLKLESSALTITLYDDGNVYDTISVLADETIVLPLPEKDGFTFDGWYSDTKEVSFLFETDVDVDLYATWVEDVAIDIAMVTDSGSIDDGAYNELVYLGIANFAAFNDKEYGYCRPIVMSDDAYVDCITEVVVAGAEVVVLPGWLFETAVYRAQTMYPDVYFILVDGTPHSADWTDFYTAENTVSILYDVHEAGFLAGYATVKDGYTNIGFMGGMAVPVVREYGIGYIAGAFYAASELDIDITFNDDNYSYLGDFTPNNSHQNLAATWYTRGVEVIFTVAGGANVSIMQAAEQNNGKIVGVDFDMSSDSSTVLTSAIKGMGIGFYDTLISAFDGTFESGGSIVESVTTLGVGLPMETSRFTTFNEIDYLNIYDDIADGTIVVPRNYSQLETFLQGLGETNYPTENVVGLD